MLNVVFDLGGVLLTWDPSAIVASVFDAEHGRTLVLDLVFGHEDWQQPATADSWIPRWRSAPPLLAYRAASHEAA